MDSLTLKILKERAQKLSDIRETESLNEAGIEVLKFELANEIFAIEIKYIKEVLPIKEITELPLKEGFVLGVINLRWQIISVLDIRKLYGIPERGISNLNRVIVLKNDRIEFGILADNIIDVTKILSCSIQESFTGVDEVRKEYLLGVTPDRVVIIDAIKILNDRKIIINNKF